MARAGARAVWSAPVDPPAFIGYLLGDAATHGTSRHSNVGNAALKHPFLGTGLCSMDSFQSLRFFFSSGESCSSAAAVADAAGAFVCPWGGGGCASTDGVV